MYENEIEMKTKELPDHLKRQVLDFIDFLATKYKRTEQKPRRFKFDWEDGLSELSDKYDSVGLQHAALEWR